MFHEAIQKIKVAHFLWTTVAANHFYLMVYNIINYNDVTFATSPYVFVENYFFTDIYRVT